MNRKQLQNLISAGIFSTALLNGFAYADVSVSTSTAKGASAKTGKHHASKKEAKQEAKTDKDKAEQGCSKANGCGGH